MFGSEQRYDLSVVQFSITYVYVDHSNLIRLDPKSK